MTTRGSFTKKNKKKKNGGMGIGTSMVLVVFVLFCLITFAALSYVTSRADYNKSVAASQSVKDYYDACSRMEKRIVEIDTSSLYGPGATFDYVEPIDDNRSLYVTLVYTGDEKNPFKISKWSSAASSDAGISIDEGSQGGMNLLF